MALNQLTHSPCNKPIALLTLHSLATVPGSPTIHVLLTLKVSIINTCRLLSLELTSTLHQGKKSFTTIKCECKRDQTEFPAIVGQHAVEGSLTT